ncbi:MAG: DUF1232 domain-containing protein [Bacteroidetes bacterium]|nr:DUF1232 domain-containing protein [Bacteroidota bacterium]MBX7044830.1 DUF1232 domain-containing protein [Ignavibacteria bacterium]
MNDTLDEIKIYDELKKKSSEVNDEDFKNVINSEVSVKKRADKLNKNVFSKLLNQLSLSYEMIKDYKSKRYTDIPWRTIALIIGAILYFVNPFDIVPDLLPVIGFTDDAVAFAAIFRSAQGDLLRYCEWKGYDPEKYF